jgi:hypothetical protein
VPVAPVVARYWPVLLIMTAVSVGFDWLSEPYLRPEDGDFFGWPELVAITCLSAFVSAIFASMIAVPWHGLLLRGEPLSGHGFSSDRRIMVYASWGFCVMLPFFASFPLFTLGSMQLYAKTGSAVVGMHGALAMMYAGSFAFLVGILIFTRLGIKVVAIALPDPNGSLTTIWRRTSWSFWRMFWGLAITVLPIYIVGFLPVFIGTAQQEAWLSTAFWSTVTTLITTLLGLVPLTFLSLAYRHFMMTPPERIDP